MTNMSSSAVDGDRPVIPVEPFSYPDMGAPASPAREQRPSGAGTEAERQQPSAPSLSANEINELVNRARLEAVAETEARLRSEYDARSTAEAGKVREALNLFQLERKDYFARVESEVVHLALAISAKILHREAQVDPMLVAALVRVAIDKLHDGSSVSVRVSPKEAVKWRVFLANPLNGSTIEVVEDAHLTPIDCILETDLGSANFSIDAQMKEVEQGFFDLLAQRPVVK
jgi:flagellar biosynthesis/type III secretory pathway protein FliH